MEWPSTLGMLTAGEDIGRLEARAAMSAIMAGEATPAQISAFIVALRIKGESVDEMTGLVEAMREASVTVEIGVPVIDIVGTGGDRAGTFNISTTAGLIAAAAGARVAKHGNRSASSQSGSADVLEALGMRIDLDPEKMADLVRNIGFGFFFAPRYHPAMRHAGPVRRELGIPTVFNFLGPLANPAGADRLVVGVSDQRMADRMIGVLHRLGAQYAFVVHGEDGLDEVTTTGPTYIHRLRDGEVTHAEFTPEDFGVERSRPEDLVGGSPEENAVITRTVLSGQTGPKLDAALINAAPGIVVAGLAAGFVEAVEVGRRAVESGAALDLLERVVETSNRSSES